MIDKKELTAFTNLNEKLCLSILETVEREFGEIGNFLLEDDEVSFEVYKDYLDIAPNNITESSFILKLIEKCDYHFYSLSYHIIPNGRH